MNQDEPVDEHECYCGRSATGVCSGWHRLSETQYQKKLAELDNTDTGRNEYQDIVSTEDCVLSALSDLDKSGC